MPSLEKRPQSTQQQHIPECPFLLAFALALGKPFASLSPISPPTTEENHPWFSGGTEETGALGLCFASRAQRGRLLSPVSQGSQHDFRAPQGACGTSQLGEWRPRSPSWECSWRRQPSRKQAAWCLGNRGGDGRPWPQETDAKGPGREGEGRSKDSPLWVEMPKQRAEAVEKGIQQGLSLDNRSLSASLKGPVLFP